MRKILLVIDMQNDFINGALGTPEAEAIVDRVAEEIGKYPAGDVIATRDTHPENYLETQEGRNLPVVHCVKGTTGWELHPKIAAALLKHGKVKIKGLFSPKTGKTYDGTVLLADTGGKYVNFRMEWKK